MKMELRVLQYFLAVAQEESISRAAEMLHVTQPTLSRQISQLEEELGAPLFTRGRRTRLTEAGMMLRRKAEEVAFLMDSIEEDFRSRSDIAGTVRIGSGIYAGGLSVMRNLSGFMAMYPKVRFDIYTATADILKERLDHGLLDFVIMQEPIDIGSYDYIRLFTKDRWGLLVSASSPLAGKDSVTRDDMKGIRYMMSGRAAVQGEVAAWLGEAPAPVMTGNLSSNLLPLAESGFAGLLTLEAAAEALDPARFRFLPLEPVMETTVVLAWKKLSSFSGSAQAYAEYVRTIRRTYEEK